MPAIPKLVWILALTLALVTFAYSDRVWTRDRRLRERFARIEWPAA